MTPGAKTQVGSKLGNKMDSFFFKYKKAKLTLYDDFENKGEKIVYSVLLQPTEDISVVSWNRQVQHILASANPSGKAVVWDLRKNEPIIKISDHSNRVGRLKTSNLYMSIT